MCKVKQNKTYSQAFFSPGTKRYKTLNSPVDSAI